MTEYFQGPKLLLTRQFINHIVAFQDSDWTEVGLR